MNYIQGEAGHLLYGAGTRYKDGSPLPKNPLLRKPCVRCKQPPTMNGHDPCISNLPKVRFACCGHGGHGYVAYEDGRVFRFVNKSGEEIALIAAINQDTSHDLPEGWTWDA